MFALRNVSSPFVVANSDTDLEAWMPSWAWTLLTAVLATLGIGHAKRDRTYRVAWGNTELFLIDSSRPDGVTIALSHNLATMRTWDSATAATYMEWKQLLSSLCGVERKAAKAAVARLFSLDSSVYA